MGDKAGPARTIVESRARSGWGPTRPRLCLGLAPARHVTFREDGFTPFAQVLTVRRSDAAVYPPRLAELIAAYRAPAVKSFILEHFEDSVRRPW